MTAKTSIWVTVVKKILKKQLQPSNESQKSHYRLFVMDMVFSIGQMVHITKDIGAITKQKAREHFGMLKVMFIEAILEMIWPMGMENTHILMDQNIKVNLGMTFKKDMERKNGLMEQSMSEAIRME